MAVTPVSTPRQTIPYADRPITDPASGHATVDFYQFLERLRVSAAATVTNVTNIITQTNADATQITALLTAVAAIEAEIVIIEAEIAALAPSVSEPPSPPARAPIPVMGAFPPFPPPRLVVADAPPARAPVFTLEMFLALDCTNAPTADPGGNRPWLKAGDWHVGA